MVAAVGPHSHSTPRQRYLESALFRGLHASQAGSQPLAPLFMYMPGPEGTGVKAQDLEAPGPKTNLLTSLRLSFLISKTGLFTVPPHRMLCEDLM